MNRPKLLNLLSVLSPDGTAVDFTEFDANVSKLKAALKEKIQAKTLEDVNTQLESFRKRVDIEPLVTAVSNIERDIDKKISDLGSLIDQRSTEANVSMRASSINTDAVTASLNDSLAELRAELDGLKTQAAEIAVIRGRLDLLPDAKKLIADALVSVNAAMDVEGAQDTIERERMVTEYTDIVEKLRKELTNRINNMPHGGNANRNIAIGGNTSVLARFTDINLKAGAGTTITYTNNQTTKYTDVTIAATGVGSGIVRSVNSISTSQTAAAVAGTDYVYICSAGVQLTLPDAIGNTNLYTVKNTSTSSVLVSTTASETIDGQSTAILPVQYTAIDLISDGANWDVT